MKKFIAGIFVGIAYTRTRQTLTYIQNNPDDPNVARLNQMWAEAKAEHVHRKNAKKVQRMYDSMFADIVNK